MHRYFSDQKPEILAEIRDTGKISDELFEQIDTAMVEVRDSFLADNPEAAAA